MPTLRRRESTQEGRERTIATIPEGARRWTMRGRSCEAPAHPSKRSFSPSASTFLGGSLGPKGVLTFRRPHAGCAAWQQKYLPCTSNAAAAKSRSVIQQPVPKAQRNSAGCLVADKTACQSRLSGSSCFLRDTIRLVGTWMNKPCRKPITSPVFPAMAACTACRAN